MRVRARLGGLVAAAGVAALVVPFMAGSPAQAAGETDLSITKTVATAAPPVTYIPALSDVRNGGSATFGRDGITIRTTGPTDKTANYWAQSGPIPSSASMSWTQTQGIFMPGMQIIFDADGILGNHVDDWNILVNVPSDNGSNWWLTPSSSATAKALAPSCQPTCSGPLVNGYPWYGSLASWVTALGPNAKVYAVGYSLGSGASGVNSGVLASMTYGTHSYDFTRHYTPSLKAAPGDTVEYQLTVSNGAAGANATGVQVNDVLPADLTYVPDSLEYTGPSWCAVTGQTLSCAGGTLPAGSSAKVWFKATISDTVSSAGLGSTIGHNVDVQKQEVFADLTAGQTKSFTVLCPSGYVPTDGGLLVDAVDQDGYYSDIVVAKSVPTTVGAVQGWLVKVSNLGDQRGQGKVKVTCLDKTIGSANGHTHDVVVAASNGAQGIAAASTNNNGELVTVTCPTGYTPVAPQHTVSSGIAVIRSSYADGSSWKWLVDHETGTAATFDVQCLAPETTSSNGHTATLPISTSSYTISADPESRTDEVVQCGPSKHGIVGGYAGEHAELLSLGKEQRGNNYMFRFWNDDWDHAYEADLSVTCVGVRTADEPVYYRISNTATISSAAADLNPADNSSTADIAIVGDAVQPAGGVVVDPSGDRLKSGGYVRNVVLGVTCTSACAFTVKVLQGSTVVAKATKSLAASPDPRFVNVPTTSAGKNLAHNDVVTVKIKTATGTTSTTVTLH